MNKSLVTATIICLAALSSFGQYGYNDSWDSRPAPSQRNDGWDYQDVSRIARPAAYAVTRNPEFGRDVAKGAKKASRGLKALFVGIGAAIAGFFKWLGDLISGKKRR